MNRKTKVILAFLLMLILTFTACGSSGYKGSYVAPTEATMNSMALDDYGFYEEYPEYKEYSESEYQESSADGAKILNDSARKLIKTYSMDVETEDFDNLLAALSARISFLGGYIENLDTYNGSNYSSYKRTRYSNLTVRIPSQNVDSFVDYVGEASNVTSKNLNVSDVTLSYVDTQSRKETLLIEQDRLLAMLEKCENVEDMIAIESRLSEVRYKIESMESQLRTYDNLVDYSTVRLNISEVEKYTEPEPVSYFEEVSRSFTDGLDDVWNGLKDFFVDFVGALPGIVLFAIIVVIIVLIVRAIAKRNKKKKAGKKANDALRKMEEAKAKAEKKANDYAE